MNKYKLEQIMSKLKEYKILNNAEYNTIYEALEGFYIDKIDVIHIDESSRKNKFLYKYPINLLDQLTGDHVIMDRTNEILSIKDLSNNVEEAINTLTDAERNIIHLFYKDQLSIIGIFYHYNGKISCDKIRDILRKALAKLRDQNCFSIICSKNSLKKEIEEKKNQLEKQKENIRATIVLYINKNNRITKEKSVSLNDCIKYLNISDLGLSPRTTNCLLESGITTFEKLFSLSNDELKQIKRLGYSGILEIKDKIIDILNTCK